MSVVCTSRMLDDVYKCVRFEYVFDVQVNLDRWILVVTNRDHPLAVEFSTMYMQVAAAIGITVAQPLILPIHNDRTETFLQAVRSRLDAQV